MEQLEEICGFKVQAHRKVQLTKKNMQCKYECNGHNITCEDYTEVKIPKDHYLAMKN